MKIKRLVIENFKSIERIELIEPNPFTVFVGPNGSGKSNIFEALEFVNSWTRIYPSEAIRQFGGADAICNRNITNAQIFKFQVEFDSYPNIAYINWDLLQIPHNQQKTGLDHYFGIPTGRARGQYNKNIFHQNESGELETSSSEQFFLRFSRIFTKNTFLNKFNYQDDISLNLAATNLELVLKRILSNEIVRDEIFEWLSLFVPQFKSIEIISEQLNESNTLHWYEQYSEKPFKRNLISDGTYNILAILTAIYQNDEPQFLCIEEPENGLNPKVVRELVNLCRYICEEKGHFIWLNTHSQTLVSQLTPEEIILVDKKQGATQTKQIKGMNLHGLPMDEAWLSNAIGGGLPW